MRVDGYGKNCARSGLRLCQAHCSGALCGLGASINPLLKKEIRRAILRYFAAGVLVGIIVACLFILNVNLTVIPIDFQNNEIAVFVIAAVGAIAAVPIVARLSGTARGALGAT